ncbi:unnamed protein product [Ectocarpus fasciculatus]
MKSKKQGVRPCHTLLSMPDSYVRRVDHDSAGVSVRHNNVRENAERQQRRSRQLTPATATAKTASKGPAVAGNIHYTGLKVRSSEKERGGSKTWKTRQVGLNVSVHIDRCLAWSKMS